MSKGVIQGVNIPFEAEASFRFADVAKYATASWQIGNVYAFYIGMNKNSYNKIPEDLKPVFQRVCGEYREKHGPGVERLGHPGQGLRREKRCRNHKTWSRIRSPAGRRRPTR